MALINATTKKWIYLITYNAVSFLLWTLITLRAVSFLVLGPDTDEYDEPAAGSLYRQLPFPLLAVTQTLAFLEVAHAALGLVGASAATTALQIGGKNLVVWTVMTRFPDLFLGADDKEGGQRGFLGCVLAWGCSEMIRYAFFVGQLLRGEPFGWIKWLRYNAFLVLYPVGIVSEAWLVYLALVQEAAGVGPVYRGYLFLGLLTYLPAGPYLFTHMLKQRRRAVQRRR
ncbi:3-hydroxy acyl-CoA dehydratase [Apiospora rasikravindrae]|uniref:Very-long-chain (3R)-3-hydroxyacyl-CoA dehydratase n=1 Tax=Apiospora rasikravindrae TaxID=990691 RepID=A0ABR1RWA9_9PEZI